MPRRADADNVLRFTRASLSRLALQPGQSDRVWWDADTPGFGYRLRGSRATWVIRPPRKGGASSLITIGPANVADLVEARKAGGDQLAQARLGDDLRATRRVQQAVQPILTVGDAFERYIRTDAEPRMRASTLANLKTHLRQHWKGLHALPLAEVTRRDVALQLGEISRRAGDGKPRPQAALRARRTLSTVYKWAIGEGLAETNPVAGTNAPATEVRRDRVLSDAELVSVWRACPPTDAFGRIVRLLILTGQRRKEISGLRWSEIDLDAGLCRLTGARTKNKKPHDFALSRPALAILAEAPRIAGRDLVFGVGAGPFSGFSKAKARLDKVAPLGEPWRLHDLRRTAATGMGEIGVWPHVVEAALNHISGAKAGVAGTYNRATYPAERREAFNKWADHLARIVAAGA